MTTPSVDKNSLTPAIAAAELLPTTLPKDVLDALRFYAHGHHYSIDDDHQSFDTVSGEPVNWMFSEKADDATMLEDGGIARAVLTGRSAAFEEPIEPVEGEVFTVLSAVPTTVSAPICATCNGRGMIGGPSYSQPDEGGEPCPDCTTTASPAASASLNAYRRAGFESDYDPTTNARAFEPDAVEALFYTARNNTLAEFKKRILAANTQAPSLLTDEQIIALAEQEFREGVFHNGPSRYISFARALIASMGGRKS